MAMNRIGGKTMNRKLYRSWAPAMMLSTWLPFVASADDAKPAATEPASTEAKKPAPGAVQRNPPGGWRTVMRGQTVYWCTKQQQFGSRMRTEERCLTPDQFEALEESSQQMVEDIRRTAPPPKGN
jgi:hypothetical protein